MCARITATMKSVWRAKNERDDAAALEKAKADAQAKSSQRINNLKYKNQKKYFADQVQKQQQAPKPPSQTSLASMLKKVFNRMV